ncbi:MAG: hypothetical protein K2L39_06590 [Muribaculaceae bacterium]|nr:hypothetical protein [Muribaculaceae bacterium]
MDKEKEKDKTEGAKGCCGRGCEDCRGKEECARGGACTREDGCSKDGGCAKEGGCGSRCGGCGGGCDLRGKLHSYDYWEDIPGGFADDDMVEVNFKNTRKGYFLNSGKIPLEVGDMVAVEAQPGHDIGRVTLTGALVRLQMRKAGIKPDAETRRVFRKAKSSDLERYEQARARENDTMIRARKIAADLKLNMKIGDVEYQGDGNKAIFYYIADERVDFRQLIKVLAETFKVRIEMKQIGARQEAGRIGGIGPCGRPLCCTTWLTNFVSVSTGAARYQDISLNPQKLAGQCAKLKCCLNFEVDAYVEASKKLPPKDAKLETADNLYHYFKADIFKREITYSTDKNIPANLVTISAARAFEVIAMNKAGEKPLALKEEDGEEKKPSEYADILGQDSLTRFDKKKKKRKPSKPASGKKEEGGSREGQQPKEGQPKGGKKQRPQGKDAPRRQQGQKDGQPKGGNPQKPQPKGEQKPSQPKAEQKPSQPKGEQKPQQPKGERKPGKKGGDRKPAGENKPS